MKEGGNMKGKLIRYSVVTLICGIATLIICFAKDLFHQSDAKTIFHILTDAFFVPGVVMAAFGLLVFSTNEGTFDMLTYGVRRLFILISRHPKDEKYRTFYDYRQAQRENKHQFGYMIIVGVLYILISFIFLAFYYQNK